MASIFKAYDIRGEYPNEVNEAIALKIGAAFVKLLAARNIVIGYDMRLSSATLADHFAEGCMAAGAKVMNIGLVTTPLLYFAIIEGAYDGGAMVTASHLPGQSNGFKLCREKAIPLSGDAGLPSLEKIVTGMADGAVEESGLPCGQRSVLPAYLDRLKTFIHDPVPLRLVIDAGNGAIGPEVLPLMQQFPMWEVVPMYMEPDGRFPHHVANPLIPKNTEALRLRVVEERAHLGIAFDGDADRCGFIDEKGEKIPEDLVTALISQVYLSKSPGSTILYDLRSSRSVPETITRLGGKAIRSRVGHAFIKAGMREHDAIFAGELSGHFYFRDTGFTDNALFAMIQMLNLLALKKSPVSTLIAPLKRYSATGEINMEVADKEGIYKALQERYKDGVQDHLDGMSVDYDSWWFNLRASNTEPLIRLNLEAGLRDEMESRKNEVLEIIHRTDPTMRIKA
ncbi:MAG: phosphomannomutase/phosphoglucomutase [Syntrophorhabdales bacterium]|jgi:phosphomannomutase